MCLEMGKRLQRRRPGPLPVLCCPDSGSDTDTEPQLLPRLPSRNSHPEIFTFDVESVKETPGKPLHRRGPSKRPRRVLYPAKVRRYLPPPETDRPLRWLYLLCLLVLVQICCEEAEELPPTGGPHGLQAGSLTPHPEEPPGSLTAHPEELPPTGGPHGLQAGSLTPHPEELPPTGGTHGLQAGSLTPHPEEPPGSLTPNPEELPPTGGPNGLQAGSLTPHPEELLTTEKLHGLQPGSLTPHREEQPDSLTPHREELPDSLTPHREELPTSGELHGLQPGSLIPYPAEPAAPFSNHSHFQPLRHIIFSWLYHQR